MTIRDHLVAALKADLIGPYRLSSEGDPPAEEVLSLPPSRWYLTGFLAPLGAREREDSDDEEMGAGSDTDTDDADAQEPDPKRRKLLPACMGLSVLLPPGPTSDVVKATINYAEYKPESRKIEGRTTPKRFWRRDPRAPINKDIQLDPAVVAVLLIDG